MIDGQSKENVSEVVRTTVSVFMGSMLKGGDKGIPWESGRKAQWVLRMGITWHAQMSSRSIRGGLKKPLY
ncbi:hypothetical protein GCM10007108_10000 [Thermogymnomonas acidicola]|uniref:Uncharacterized protein n=1 Tax=Thermogymnomonas acidicola TaxID=399579 RepID=A0AA37BRJ7_9ARCH|nr:hypothetical protein GCM10007108_10000 [Thermogymnomonas acidicola]